MKKGLWIGLVLAVITGAAGYKYVGKSKARDKKAAASLITASQGPIEETVEATGDVSPLNRVEIKPPISGRVEKLLVDEGDRVAVGQVLAWMSSSDRAAILDAARAQGPDELKKWEDAYKPTPILAPLSGGVILRNVVVGQTVDPSTVLFAMSDKLIVVARVDEADIGRVRNKMPTRITLDAYPDQPIEGAVFQILHEGKNVSNVITYGVKIEPIRVPPFFRSQMTANVSFILRRKEEAVLILAAALIDGKSGKKQVSVPDGEGKPSSRDVEIGIQSGENVEVLAGLAAGDSLFITRSRYAVQKATQSSPLTMGGNRPAGSGSSGARQRHPG